MTFGGSQTIVKAVVTGVAASANVPHPLMHFNRRTDMAGKGSGKSAKSGTGKVAMTPGRASAIQGRTMKTVGAVGKRSFATRA
jgi:hypothetical protein